MLFGQYRILGGMVDHQIQHHPHAVLIRPAAEAADQIVRAFGRSALEAVMQPVGVLDRIEAAGKARIMDGVEEDPIELHSGDTRQMPGPILDRSDQQREEVVDAWSESH